MLNIIINKSLWLPSTESFVRTFSSPEKNHFDWRSCWYFYRWVDVRCKIIKVRSRCVILIAYKRLWFVCAIMICLWVCNCKYGPNLNCMVALIMPSKHVVIYYYQRVLSFHCWPVFRYSISLFHTVYFLVSLVKQFTCLLSQCLCLFHNLTNWKFWYNVWIYSFSWGLLTSDEHSSQVQPNINPECPWPPTFPSPQLPILTHFPLIENNPLVWKFLLLCCNIIIHSVLTHFTKNLVFKIPFLHHVPIVK